MATARVPLLDLTGHLPESYAPPSVAIDAQTATTQAQTATAQAGVATTKANFAESARAAAVIAQGLAETAANASSVSAAASDASADSAAVYAGQIFDSIGEAEVSNLAAQAARDAAIAAKNAAELAEVHAETAETNAAASAAAALASQNAAAGSPPTRGLIITDANVTTIPAGTTADNLAAYYNSGASAITVAGVELAAGSHAVWAWVSGAWTLLASGTTGGSEPPTEGPTTVTPTAPTANDTDATVGTLAANSYRIPASTGVDYKVGGATKAAGDYSVGNVATSVTVTAFAQTGYVLSGTDSWTFNFTATASYVTTFYDNLTAANGTAIVGRTSSDGLATWSYASGTDSQTASIQSNRMEASTTGNTLGNYALARTATASAGTPQRVRISWAYQTTGATCTVILPIIRPNGNPLTTMTVTISFPGNLSVSSPYSSLTTLTGDTTGWLTSGTVTLTVVGSAVTITDGTRTATCSLNNATLADPQHVLFNTATNYIASQKTYYDEPKVEVML